MKKKDAARLSREFLIFSVNIQILAVSINIVYAIIGINRSLASSKDE